MAEFGSRMKTADFLPSGGGVVARALVRFEAGSPVCALAAEHFAALLQAVDPGVAKAIAPLPMSAIDDMAIIPASGNGQAAWDRLGRGWTLLQQRRFDGDPAPQCVLIVSAANLVDDETRQQFAETLATLKGRFSSYLLVFLDDSGEMLLPGTREETLQAWAMSFAALIDLAEVRCYLLSTSLDTGEHITADELASIVAVALCADLVVATNDARRILSWSSSQPNVAIGTLGGRSVQFAAEEVAKRMGNRLVGDLLKPVLAERGRRPMNNLDLPTTVPELLSASFPKRNEFNARPLSERNGRRGEFLPHTPALNGPGFKFSVDLGAMAKGLSLDHVPRRKWKEQLYQWDFIVREHRVADLVERVAGRLEREADRQSQAIASVVADEFAMASTHAATDLCDYISSQVKENYAVRVSKKKTRSLKEDLKALDQALTRIPHGPSLLVRTFLLLVVQGYLVVQTLMGSSRWQTQILVGLGVLALLTIVFAAFSRIQAAARAEQARDRTLQNSEGRAQLLFCEAMQAEVLALRERFVAEVERHRERIAESGKQLESLAYHPADVTVASRTRLIHYLPTHERESFLYERFFANDLGTNQAGELMMRFRDRLRTSIGGTLDGRTAPAAIATQVTEFTRAELRKRLSGRYRLWHFFRSELDSGDIDAERATRSIEPLGEGFPFACLRGAIVEEQLLDPHQCHEYFTGPLVLSEFAPADKEFIESANENVVAIISRVDLLTLSLTRDADAGVEKEVAEPVESHLPEVES